VTSDYVLLKGGGGHIGGHIHIGALTRLRHHPWTDTNDIVPRTDGRGSGLEPPPSRKKRVVNWAKFMKKQLKKEVAILKDKLKRKLEPQERRLNGSKKDGK
jgi:hypothetical protein